MEEQQTQEEVRWNQMMENFNLLFSRVNDIGASQQQLKAQMEHHAKHYAEQHQILAKQVQATGQAVAQFTLHRFDEDAHSSDSNTSSTVHRGRPQEEFSNEVFAEAHRKAKFKQSKVSPAFHVPRSALPKLHVPTFDGLHPRIWLDKCLDYFAIFEIPEHLWVKTATMHFEGKAAKWLQAYKQSHKLNSWASFCVDVKEKFGFDDYRIAVTELFALRQTGTVEEYTALFESLQFDISMHNNQYDDLFFVSKYIGGLNDDIRGTVESQVPPTVDRAAVIAKIQQGIVERQKARQHKSSSGFKAQASTSKVESKSQPPQSPLWRERQLRDYRRTHGLCFHCGEKYEPGHLEVRPKKTKAHLNTLAINDLDIELTEEVLNQLVVEDALAEEFCQLSLNALSSVERMGCLKLRAMVNNTAMHFLLDNGSSHTFVSSAFVKHVGLPTITVSPRQVTLANGQSITTVQMVPNLQWWCQGHTLQTDMLVLDMAPYDAILGFDWLSAYSPMNCNWANRSISFHLNGKPVHLQGLPPPPLQLTAMTPAQLWKATRGNDIWAFAVVDSQSISLNTAVLDPLQTLLSEYEDLFQEPTQLPPSRAYDHSIPLQPRAAPFNSRPYRYSPLHKTEIEQQVQQLLNAGLITHSSSPFASPVLKLNDLTIKNRFPLPVIEEILDELHGYCYFTKLDMRPGYHQIRMLETDEYKTAFKTHHGHYQFKVMPFSLTNAPATFQCVMNDILKPFLRKCVLVFLDDILIYSPTMDLHIAHVKQVLETMRTHKLYLKPSKCSFAQTSIDYLGHIISAQGVATGPTKTVAIQNWPQPTTVTELPLTQLLKHKAFCWSDQATKAFFQLKEALTSTPVLALPNFNLPFTVKTDACGEGIGAVLMQQGQPIAYLSKGLSEKHKSLSIYEKGFLAVILAIEKWRSYLQRQKFTIITDHKSRLFLLNNIYVLTCNERP
ncbi:hypothetical protein U9M48_027023 [Paspalum notatum var. saurae]|uniref:Reverse transcriptase domain-containing protein n=1 Tax=Paspalum notatum var. saurae TaxID=547442 RepID=A0AAQ3WZL8_PASNO